ncbi:LacI family DNA-binding transcriptional regulator [Methyloraptor flagellatus]|jgi:LacI family transcriptional regulator|uniref:LacI family DNA-binding transcriptional regulator n=1 Tax=Methyloraptor flagellatus TaxID=3162530 RepID=A0AAU7XG97_9HYPH
MVETRSGAPKAGAGRPATIVDIAAAAGVSKSTVSLVLRGSPLVKAETREKVERVIERYGYVYNRGAANLRKATSSFVGLLISDLMNPFFTELAVGVEDALYRLGFVPILANTNEDLERQAHVLRSLREHNLAGVIMSPARGSRAWDLANLPTRSVPTVITMRRVEGSPLPYVGPDNRAGSRKATEHLIGLGHRRIAYVGGYASITTQQERIAGWRDALHAAGLPADHSLIFESMPTRAGGLEAAATMLASSRRPTAIVCYNDVVAIGATRAIAEAGLVVGRDVAVVGFDDIAEAADNNPPLTTIDAGTRGIGQRAAEVLLGLIHGADPAEVGHVGETRLVVRASSGAGPAPQTSNTPAQPAALKIGASA